MVKNLPAMWETCVQSLGWEDPLEKGQSTHFQYSWVAQMVKNLPVMWENWVQFLGWKNLLEKRTTTHTNILAWRIPQTEEPGGLQSMGSQRVGNN